ncbi:hypothetical protein PHYBOEH_003518 [Phytophthora boehmeriae]|uniref:Uncharacterized protein n=1 Tax=Phytophthora boehmeriae TaxID=109152 RepID=A0A8T1XF28_9STRA|nr:hypothetical protein PHYBOEH_003518 [Phytophthora boehmeriae]
MITIAGEDSGDVEGMSSDTTTDGYTSTVTIEVLNYPIPSGSLCDCVYFPDEFTLKACDDQAEWGSFQVILSGVISYLGEPVYEEKVCYEVDFVDVAGVYGTCADTFGRVITDDYDLCVVSNTAEESSSSIESATVSSTTSSIETESSSDTAFRGSSSSSTPASNSLDSTAPATTAPPVESESSFAKPTRSSVSGLLTFVLLAALALQ